MKIRAAAILMMAAVAGAGCGRKEGDSPEQPPSATGVKPAPLVDVEVGTEFFENQFVPTIKASGAKLVVVDVWAPLCISCMEESVKLSEKKDALAKKGVLILGLGYTDSLQGAQSFNEGTDGKVSFPLYRARWAFAKHGLEVTPTLMLFDTEGKLLFKTDPLISDHPLEDLEKKIDEALKG